MWRQIPKMYWNHTVNVSVTDFPFLQLLSENSKLLSICTCMFVCIITSMYIQCIVVCMSTYVHHSHTCTCIYTLKLSVHYTHKQMPRLWTPVEHVHLFSRSLHVYVVCRLSVCLSVCQLWSDPWPYLSDVFHSAPQDLEVNLSEIDAKINVRGMIFFVF